MERIDVKNREKITNLFQLLELAEEKQLITEDERKGLVDEARRPRTVGEIASYYSWKITENFKTLLKYKHEDIERYSIYSNELANLAGLLNIRMGSENYHSRLENIYKDLNNEYDKIDKNNVVECTLSINFGTAVHDLIETVMEGNIAKISYTVHGDLQRGIKSYEEKDWKIDRKTFFSHLVMGEIPIFKKLPVVSDEVVLTEDGRSKVVKSQLVQRLIPIADIQSINGDYKIKRILNEKNNF